jgi:hypothetical protein
MSWGKTTGRLREGVHVGPVMEKGLESYRRNGNFLQSKIITRSVTGKVSTIVLHGLKGLYIQALSLQPFTPSPTNR